MGALFADALLVPAFLLAVAGFVVPRLLARLLPEGVSALFLNAFVSTLLLVVIAGAVFFGLYLWQGADPEMLLQSGWVANIAFFGRLGLAAAIIWAPIMLLSVAGLPRKWKKATW